jgi:two-component system nitrogen regulation sensor histidine kinase NtrY
VSLKWKVTITLTAAFVAMVTLFLSVLVPFQREQRLRLLGRDERLLSTLREKYERDLIYDILSVNQDSLAIDLADLARQPDILWVRLQAQGLGLAATAEPRIITDVLGDEAPRGPLASDAVLIVDESGRADLVGAGGRPLLTNRRIAMTPPLAPDTTRAFQEIPWRGETVLDYRADLRAADDSYGRLEVLYSLAALRHSESLTRTMLYGLAGSTFLVVLLLLNVLLSRIVLAPVHQVQEAMAEAATGDLDVRLPAFSRDEIGAIAESFNRMVADLAASKRKIEEYSRNLEGMVQERTAELRAVIAHVATGVISLDTEGRITTFNDRAAEILGVARGEAVGRSLEELLADPERRPLAAFVADVLGGSTELKKGQLGLRLPQGRRTLSVVASALPSDGERGGAVVVFDDLTQILTTQRLEAWKEAVERVIHEIKNPLTPVGLTAQTLKSAYASDRRRFDELFPSAIDIILQAVTSLKELISEFTRFSRLPRVQLRRQDVNALVREALGLYVPASANGVRVLPDLAAEVPAVEADPEQLKRVLINVLNNAVEAMEGRSGDVRVSTRGPDASGLVTIAVADQGPGIEDVERVFEPYYTTKAKGTGLGLLISRQIVEEHGGSIRVRSRLGEGTVVEILLPAGG